MLPSVTLVHDPLNNYDEKVLRELVDIVRKSHSAE
jgi:hypothetical protein